MKSPLNFDRTTKQILWTTLLALFLDHSGFAANIAKNGSFDINNHSGWNVLRSGAKGAHASISWAATSHYQGLLGPLHPSPGEALVTLNHMPPSVTEGVFANGVICELSTSIPALSLVKVRFDVREISPIHNSIAQVTRPFGAATVAKAPKKLPVNTWETFDLSFHNFYPTEEILINLDSDPLPVPNQPKPGFTQFVGHFALRNVSVDFERSICLNGDFKGGMFSHWSRIYNGSTLPAADANLPISFKAVGGANGLYGVGLETKFKFPSAVDPTTGATTLPNVNNTGIKLTLQPDPSDPSAKVQPGQSLVIGMRMKYTAPNGPPATGAQLRIGRPGLDNGAKTYGLFNAIREYVFTDGTAFTAFHYPPDINNEGGNSLLINVVDRSNPPKLLEDVELIIDNVVVFLLP